MAQCNEMLLRIKVPETISRMPQSLLEFKKRRVIFTYVYFLKTIIVRNVLYCRFAAEGVGAVLFTACAVWKAT